ncbi:hypothetical protein SDC9_198673 [bioreactor metagenome]|uniref:Uncharacterized protein n=1 Tax=bioreactor metagenome TaxID=1076179 RepID=A0A645IJJ4_9ZZZZ
MLAAFAHDLDGNPAGHMQGMDGRVRGVDMLAALA